MLERLGRIIMRNLRGLSVRMRYNLVFLTNKTWISFSARINLERDASLNMAPGAIVRDGVLLLIGKDSSLSLAERATVDHGGEIAAVSGAKVSIGAGTSIGGYCNIRSDKSITIGENCFIAQFVTIADGGYKIPERQIKISRDRYQTSPVSIGSNVWIGAGVIILPGVTIGDGCVIGAGAVVTKSMPHYSIAVGNPAKVIRER